MIWNTEFFSRNQKINLKVHWIIGLLSMVAKLGKKEPLKRMKPIVE